MIVEIWRPHPTLCGNPNGLVSLYTVLEFCAEDFCRAASIIAQYRQQIYSGILPTDGSRGMVAGELGTLERHCAALGLVATNAQIQRVKAMWFGDHAYTQQMICDAIMEVSSRLVDELEAKKIYVVSSDRNPYVVSNNFSPIVMQRFPDAIADMDEAARCFAFERPTACIFHLMRVTEFAVNEIAGLIGIEDHNPTWEPIIRKIDAEMKAEYKARKFKGNRDILANMSTHLHAVKVAWRNKTMHVEKINTMEHAKEIYDVTAGLMRYLAENLPSKKTGFIQSIRAAIGGKP